MMRLEKTETVIVKKEGRGSPGSDEAGCRWGGQHRPLPGSVPPVMILGGSAR